GRRDHRAADPPHLTPRAFIKKKDRTMAFSDYKTALVTGASGGMGWAIAERLRAKGLTVHALARNADKLQELADRCGVIPHAVDVSDTEAVTALVKDLEIDVLVNNAGVSRPGS